MLNEYFEHEIERKKMGIPPLSLNPEQTKEVCRLLETVSDNDQGRSMYTLIQNRVSPGVDPAAGVKAAWLDDIAMGKRTSGNCN